MSKRALKCDVTVGIVIAAGIVMSGHGEDTIAEDLLRAAGVTSAEKAKAVGVDDYDIEILAPVFAALSRKDPS